MLITKQEFTEKQERDFLAWIRTLPSCLSGKRPCQSCHVRSVAEGAGTATKPRLYAVPMTQKEHDTQTNQGYLAAIKKHGTVANVEIWYADIDDGKMGLSWFKSRAYEYREKFLKINSQ